MKHASEWILSRQIQWAHNNGITLVGSKGQRGRRAYTEALEDNLFVPLDIEARAAFSGGDGGELKGTANSLPKMHAVHSSSALGINIFQYWKAIGDIPAIAAACGFCREGNPCAQSIHFEAKYPICSKFSYAPNIDAVFRNAPGSPYEVFAVECKFSEAYSGRKHGGIDPKYRDLEDIWSGIPNLHELALSISPDPDYEKFTHLHPAQLIKHILGLKGKCKGKTRFRLLYLWYDALGKEGAKHRKEIEGFEEIAREDGVKFHALSYQELIANLASRYRDKHWDYIDYITSRYL